jgi:hypothetical protein
VDNDDDEEEEEKKREMKICRRRHNPRRSQRRAPAHRGDHAKTQRAKIGEEKRIDRDSLWLVNQ